MPRQKKNHLTKEQRDRHEAALLRRRERHREKRTMEMAAKAAEGQSDFAALVEVEKKRITGLNDRVEAAIKGGSQSPKVTTKARDNLSAAFDYMGGVPALVVWGRQNPTEFYRLWARLIPREQAETSVSLPLETLLEKLATKEAMSVGEAALQVGEEVMLAAREKAKGEDEVVLYKGESIQ